MARTERLLTLKAAFLAQWLALDGKDDKLIQAKLDLLCKDPLSARRVESTSCGS